MRRARHELLLPLALGLADGILNALTLASGSLVGDGGHVTAGLSVRISVAALVTAGFSVFVATYSEARGGLRHASQQLSLSSDEGLAATKLGQDALRHALTQAGMASGASMVGALVPLLIAASLPGPAWIAAVVAVAALGGLGAGLATVVHGRQLVWAGALVLGGIAVTAVGVWIKIT
jgi:hypothetical protein